MKVLLFHNAYTQEGGEDAVARNEAALLRRNGVEVVEIRAKNAEGAMKGASVTDTARNCTDLVYSRGSYEMAREACERERPDIAHIHNFWMKLSPSVHAGCQAAGVPTVQTLHNYRLLCVNALLLRDGKVCEDCVGHLPWRGVVRKCYRDSTAASGAAAAMITFNRSRGTWNRDVSVFIALTEFSRKKFVDGGLPSGRLLVKPNFVEDTAQGPPPPSVSHDIVYLGRLSNEKGVDVLLRAWWEASHNSLGRLVLIGDGPEAESLRSLASDLSIAPERICFLGRLEHQKAMEIVGSARALIVPSVWYENFPMTILEAMMNGRPVVVSNIGALGQIVPHGRCGLQFAPGNVAQLAACLHLLLKDDGMADRLGAGAREEYLSKYTPEKNLQILLEAYRRAMGRPS